MLFGVSIYAIAYNRFVIDSSYAEQIIHPENSKAKRLPQAIIVGCRKSGTRALLKFLEVNPTIRAARREVHFFDRPHNYKLGLSWYREQMPETNPNELTIEKSPAYFVTKNVGERIKRMNSTIKLIVIFRDPVTRLISDFSQTIANKLGNDEDNDDNEGRVNDDYYKKGGFYFGTRVNSTARGIYKSVSNDDVWFKAERELEEYILRPDGGVNDQRRAIRVGMYSVYLEKWLSLFQMRQMHFVDGERLIAAPAEELQKLEKFLGLKPYIRREHFVFDPRKGFYCLNGTISMIHHGGHKILGPPVDADMEPHCLSRSKGRRHVRLSKRLVGKLKEFYGPFNQYLYTLTGISFEGNNNGYNYTRK